MMGSAGMRCGFESELIERAPHMVIASHPEPTVDRIRRWVLAIERDALERDRGEPDTPPRATA